MEVAHGSEDQGGRLSDLVQKVQDVVRRRWLTLLIVTAVVFAACVAAILMITPSYTATASIHLDPDRNPLVRADVARGDLNPEAIETEVSILKSADLARNVTQKLKLTSNAEVTADIRDYGSLTDGEKQAAVARALLKKLSVNRDKLTYLITVSFTSEDPHLAAAVANAFAEGYIAMKLEASTGVAGSQADWFRKQLEALANEVRAADARVADYRSQAGLIQGPNGSTSSSIADQQVAALSSQLASAESEAAAARSALAVALQQVNRGGLDSVGEVRNSPVIADLRRQRAEILRNVGEVEARYGPRHPESIRVRDQLSAIDAQIKDEAERAVGSLRAAAAAAEARAASLRSNMSSLESQQGRNTRNAVIADSLEREATAKRAAYERMSQKWLDSTQAAKNQLSQAVISETAEVPDSPSFPKKGLLFALSLVVALAVAIAVVIVQEMLVRGLRTISEVENAVGLPVLAAIPRIRTGQPADELYSRPTSLFAESFRIARTAVLGVRTKTPPKVIAISSALPGEGKTTSAVAFARTLAMNGSRTILVEGDVRRAQVRTIVHNPSTGPGMVELLHGEAQLADVIKPGDTDNLVQIIVNEPYYSSENLFDNERMVSIINELRAQYDFVVLDLPPLVGLADGRVLAALADVVVLAVAWSKTPATAVVSAVNWLRSDGSNPIGVIYTMVDTAAEAIGGLYYSKKYSSYYRSAA